ncbi:hypothetical protein HispidOSU_019787, partial [Sigmodon hispidus]
MLPSADTDPEKVGPTLPAPEPGRKSTLQGGISFELTAGAGVRRASLAVCMSLRSKLWP